MSTPWLGRPSSGWAGSTSYEPDERPTVTTRGRDAPLRHRAPRGIGRSDVRIDASRGSADVGLLRPFGLGPLDRTGEAREQRPCDHPCGGLVQQGASWVDGDAVAHLRTGCRRYQGDVAFVAPERLPGDPAVGKPNSWLE